MFKRPAAALIYTLLVPLGSNAAEVELDCVKGLDTLLADVKIQPETKTLQQSDKYIAYELGLSTYTTTHSGQCRIQRQEFETLNEAMRQQILDDKGRSSVSQ